MKFTVTYYVSHIDEDCAKVVDMAPGYYVAEVYQEYIWRSGEYLERQHEFKFGPYADRDVARMVCDVADRKKNGEGATRRCSMEIEHLFSNDMKQTAAENPHHHIVY